MSGDRATSPDVSPYVLTADDLHALTTYDFPVVNGPGGRPCVFKMRRLDLFTRLLEDIVPLPLLREAISIADQIAKWMGEDGATFESVFAQIDDTQKRTFLETLRTFACNAVIQPKLVMRTTDLGPGEFPVVLLSGELLMALWNSTPPQATVPRLSEVAASDFRPAAEGDTPATGSHGEAVRSAPLVLDPQPGPVGQP